MKNLKHAWRNKEEKKYSLLISAFLKVVMLRYNFGHFILLLRCGSVGKEGENKSIIQTHKQADKETQ